MFVTAFSWHNTRDRNNELNQGINMELTAYNSGYGDTRANALLNTNLLNTNLLNSPLQQQTSLSRTSASQSRDNSYTFLRNVPSKIVDNTTLSGNILSVVGNGNTLNAAAGDSILSVSGNNNVLNGESGNDVFSVVGNGNTLTGGLGNDILSAKGNNTLIGGIGNDTFVIPSIYLSSSGNDEAVQGQSLIQDFELLSDKLQLPTLTTVVKSATGATSSFRVVEFNELTLTSRGQNTFISYQGNPLAELKNVSSSQLKETDFVQPKTVVVQGVIVSL